MNTSVLLILLLSVCLVCAASTTAGNTVILSLATPAHVIGDYNAGNITLHFDAQSHGLELKDKNGNQLFYADNLNGWTVKLMGENYYTPKEFVAAFLSHRLIVRELNSLVDASTAVGALGITGTAYPAILSLYMPAMRLTNALPSPATSSIQSHNATNVGCLNPPIGETCLGMCGNGCNCWTFVCGDCCFHVGCYCHDLCCKSYFSWGCLFPFGFDCKDGYQCEANENYPVCYPPPNN